MLGLIGKKLGTTQIYAESGAVIPVTVVRILSNVVSAVKTQERHGYNAVQLAYGVQKEGRLNKAELGQLKARKLKPYRGIKEFRTAQSAAFKTGAALDLSSVAVGDKVNIQGVSKGKGFQGVMKRYHFAGGCDSHGTSVAHRVPGSIGQGTYPGRVIKGKKMPGHMGDRTVTVKNLEIAGIEAEQQVLLFKGAVPGGKNATIYIYPQDKDFEGKVLASFEPKEEQKPEAETASA